MIVATANHFWLDAVGGLICLAFGYTVARLWYGKLPHSLPKRVAKPHTHPQSPTASRGRAGARPPAAVGVNAEPPSEEPNGTAEDRHPPARTRPTPHP